MQVFKKLSVNIVTTDIIKGDVRIRSQTKGLSLILFQFDPASSVEMRVLLESYLTLTLTQYSVVLLDDEYEKF